MNREQIWQVMQACLLALDGVDPLTFDTFHPELAKRGKKLAEALLRIEVKE